MYAERYEPENEFVFECTNLIDREVYQIFLDIQEDTNRHTAFEREVEVCSEGPGQKVRKARGKAERPREHVHVKVLRRTCY